MCQPCRRRTSWAIASPPRGRCDAADSPWFGAAARSTAAGHARCDAALACTSTAGSGARKGSSPALQPAHRAGIRALVQGLHPLSRASPLLRDALAARRIRHPHSSGPVRTRERGNDQDLHTRIENGRQRCAQPALRAGCSRATPSGRLISVRTWPTTASRAPSDCSMSQEQNWHQLVVSRIQFSTANPEILLKWRSLPVTSTAPTDSA